MVPRSVTELTNQSIDDVSKPWEEDIQYYVHLAYSKKKLLDGHKLMLSGMSTSEGAKDVKSFLDLFSFSSSTENEDQSKVDEESSPDCQCFEKMVFCGYNVYETEDAFAASEGGNASEINDTDKTIDKSDTGHTTLPMPDLSKKYTLWSAGSLDQDELSELSDSCGRSRFADKYECTDWGDLRHFLSSNFVKHYPTLEQDIINFRKGQLQERGLIDTAYDGDTKEWTLVGLAQRTYRRSWLNLAEVMKACDTAEYAKEAKVLCVVVNVEHTASPYEQLLLHRSVDALIGVHGAQLTQAVLLPPHGHILELLPWVPNYIRGAWVQTRHTPTPLGIIYHNTDLNHLGYSLGRDSVPLCEGVDDDQLEHCFLKNKKNFMWDVRDFNVRPDIVIQYIERFVLYMKGEQRQCKDVEHRLDDKFVLYNVWCAWDHGEVDSEVQQHSSPQNTTVSLRHYYHDVPLSEIRRPPLKRNIGTGKKTNPKRRKKQSEKPVAR